jgi:hypothetical protein
MFSGGLAFAALGIGHVVNPATQTVHGNPVVLLAIGLGLIIFSVVIVLRSGRQIFEFRDGTIRFQWIRRSREV